MMKKWFGIVALVLLFCSGGIAHAQSTAATLSTSSNTQAQSAGQLTLPYFQGTMGSTGTIDWTKSTYNIVAQVTASTTLTFTPPYGPTDRLTLKLCQDSTGGRTVTFPVNVFDGGAAAGTDNVFPLQVSKCGTVTFSFDGVNYDITSKPYLPNNCSGQAVASSSSVTVSNKCCTATTNVFECTDITGTGVSACNIACSGGTITIKTEGASDSANWVRLN